jgi:hypothetical protein
VLIAGQQFRDDLIVSAGNDASLIKAYSALSLFQRNFIFFLSPILLSVLFAYLKLSICVNIIIALQLVLYVMYITYKTSTKDNKKAY